MQEEYGDGRQVCVVASGNFLVVQKELKST